MSEESIDEYENDIFEFDPLKNHDGKPYQHNAGAFRMVFEGLALCEFGHIMSEALLVYHKPNTERKAAELELASLHKERMPYGNVSNAGRQSGDFKSYTIFYGILHNRLYLKYELHFAV